MSRDDDAGQGRAPGADGSAGLPMRVRELLAARGPLTSRELEDALSVGGDQAGRVRDDLDDLLFGEFDEGFVALADGRWVWAPGLLAGRIFTHRLTPEEAAGDYLQGAVDVVAMYPLWLLPGARDFGPVTGTAALLDGKAMEEPLLLRGVPLGEITRGSVALFPRGCFAGIGAAGGELIGIRVTSDGLRAEPVAQDLPAGPSARLYELVVGAPEPQQIEEVIWQVCAEDDEAFRAAVIPLSDLAAIAGLSLSPSNGGEQIAGPGFDWGRRGRI
ncbi:hypothetical protein [Tsukamurella hominis]|uniref:hypothetical protein n=1 Tax=Tsukamurella hominis TaxID=1970232 RepID=UPI0039ED5B00